jgi:hypothetical protein
MDGREELGSCLTFLYCEATEEGEEEEYVEETHVMLHTLICVCVCMYVCMCIYIYIYIYIYSMHC